MKASDTKTFTKVEKHIRTMTDAYLELGVCVIKDGWRTAYFAAGSDREQALTAYRKEYLSITSDTFVRAYLRAVAKELKRPFVVATLTSEESISLVIPRKKYTEPLFAGFLLMPEALKRYPRSTDPVCLRGTPTNVEVAFNGEEGKRV